MINSLDRIFDGLIEMLRDQVLPRLADDFARGQVYGAMDLLANLKTRVELSPSALRDEVAEEVELIARVSEILAGLGPAAPAIAPPPPVPRASELAAAQAALDEHLCRIIDWISEHRAEIPAERAEAAERAIRDQQRARLKRAVKLIAPTLFGEMSRGQ